MNEHFLTDIEIKEFKCFTDFKAEGFKRVNLIGGKNNIGKTAFMEACYINLHSKDINTMLTALGKTRHNRETVNLSVENYSNLFFVNSIKDYKANSNLVESSFSINKTGWKVEYVFSIDNKETILQRDEVESFDITYAPNIYFIDNYGLTNYQLNQAFQSIQKQDKESELNGFIHAFDSNIESFKVIGDKPLCKSKNEYFEITEFGDGLKHYISIICALYASKEGYLFIDEIENGIHHIQIDRFWEIILTLAKQNNCQVFTTTHSKETLESFARVCKKIEERDISYTTLVKNKQQDIKALTRDYDMISDSLENGRELRGW
ncbi:MAG: AAA family ATPase [Methylococcaceae bacterium]|nr:AAA family ATPase [Methylococcaceae bacterium]